MKTFLSLRTSLVVAASAAALSAHAIDAFSSLSPGPNLYDNVTAYDVSTTDDQGFQFTTTSGGTLSGFQVAMNDLTNLTPKPFTFRLYTDSGSNTLGTLLGTYTATSSGVNYTTTRSTLVSIPATGPAVNLLNNTKYWVYATATSANNVTFWNGANSGTTVHLMNGFYGSGSTQAAFSVQVQAVPEPAPMAAVGLGALALARRRRVAKA